MKKWLIVLAAALALSLATGYSAYQRRVAVNDQFCTLDTTLVGFIDKSIAGVTKAQITKAHITQAEYTRAYNQDVALIADLIKQSPCRILIPTPANVFAPSSPTLPPRTTATAKG